MTQTTPGKIRSTPKKSTKKKRRTVKKTTLPKNLSIAGSDVPPRTILSCAKCGAEIFTGVLRIQDETIRIMNRELRPIDKKAVFRPNQRPACPKCKQITDLVVKSVTAK